MWQTADADFQRLRQEENESQSGLHGHILSELNKSSINKRTRTSNGSGILAVSLLSSMNFDNLLYTGQAQTSSTEQLTPDALSLKWALQGALQMWAFCISEELKPGGQTEVNTLGSSPRSVANQLMMEMTTELWLSFLVWQVLRAHVLTAVRWRFRKTFAQISPSCHCFMRNLGYFFTIMLDDIKIFPLLKLSQMRKVLPVVAFSNLYFPPPVLVLRMLCGKGCQIQSLWKQFISNYKMLF